MDRLVNAVYGLAHEPEGHIPAAARGLRAFLGEFRGKVQRFVDTLPPRPSEPDLEREWESIHSSLRNLERCMASMDLMVGQVEMFKSLVKALVYR